MHSHIFKISTHTLTWSVTDVFARNTRHPIISTHTLTWSVTLYIGTLCGWKLISTHTLTWSVTIIPSKTIPWQKISTHTLTWSVTKWKLCIWQNMGFQLTRSRGAWRLPLFLTQRLLHFNSHAHVERDLPLKYFYIHSQNISTHTLTWSVTCASIKQPPNPIFQLTRSRGAWRKLTDRCALVCTFQLTRSRGAWPCRHNRNTPNHAISTHTLTWSVTRRLIGFGGCFLDFNSHAHVERDGGATPPESFRPISTHTLTWSVTVRSPSSVSSRCISTHTLTWSVTGRGWKNCTRIHISTHTLTWSVTNMNGFNVNMTKISTHTLTWSVTNGG